MEIFELSKTFPAEEKHALTSQIRRSSRSISMNLREAWAKRGYELTSSASLPTATVKIQKPTLHSTLQKTADTSPRSSISN
jgi:hypothetical protein